MPRCYILKKHVNQSQQKSTAVKDSDCKSGAHWQPKTSKSNVALKTTRYTNQARQKHQFVIIIIHSRIKVVSTQYERNFIPSAPHSLHLEGEFH